MKRIIVCCDGTRNADDTQSNDANVALLARAIYGSQQTDVLQIVLYLRGVGSGGLNLETWIEGRPVSASMTTYDRPISSSVKTIYRVMRSIC
jgi:uncharacterized protein (DUF2235 family)